MQGSADTVSRVAMDATCLKIRGKVQSVDAVICLQEHLPQPAGP